MNQKRAIEFAALAAIILCTMLICVVVAGELDEQSRARLALPQSARSMSCNDALRAGFRIYDPDGFEVERFDETGHWTFEEK